MKSLLSNKRFIFWIWSFLPWIIGNGRAQSPADIAEWQLKYPKNPVILSTKKMDVSIGLDNDAPVINIDSHEELAILADNATYLSDSREYFSNHFELKKLEAYSLVPDHNLYKKLPVRNFNKSVEMDNRIFYDDQYVFGFTFPSVVKGARLITRYSMSTSYSYLPVIFDFGERIPAENMVISLTCPKNIHISYHLFGKDTSIIHFKLTEKGNRMVYQWQADNPKSYYRDSEAPGLRYFLPHLIIQLAGYTVQGRYIPVIGSLKDLYSFNYANLDGLQDQPSDELKILTDSVTSFCRSDRDKVRSIFRWVQKNIKYIAIEDGTNGIVPRNASLVLKRRYGDCKDKTSILVAMIRSQGLKASYAWIGSRNLPYKYSQFPSVVDDDHMIAVWWDEHELPVILDGTTYSHSLENIPAFIQGKECMIERGPDNFLLYTIPVARPEYNLIYDSLAIELKGDTVRGQGFASYSGEKKADLISEFEGKDTSSWNDILLKQLPLASNKTTIKSVRLSDITDVDAPFTIRYEFFIPGYLVRTSNNLYINLYLNRFLNQLVIREDRWMPLESEMTLDHLFICSLRVPGGSQIGRLPDNTVYEKPDFSFHENYSGTGDRVILSSHIKLNFQVIDGKELNEFREMLTILNRNYLKSLPLEKPAVL